MGVNLKMIPENPFSEFDQEHEGNDEFMESTTNESMFYTDSEFDWLYPREYQELSLKHWSPLSIARRASKFLALPGSRVLDIGSGIGKFCLTAAHHHPSAFFTGVEQRLDLIHFAEKALEYTQFTNVNFIHSNIIDIDFRKYDHFYFYNSFHENIDQQNRIDDAIETSIQLHTFYTDFLFNTLNERPAGTRLVTFHGPEKQAPDSYKLVEHSTDKLLRMWIKK